MIAKNGRSLVSELVISKKGCSIALFVLVFLVHLLYSSFVHSPLIHGDESGYLMNAAALVGYRSAAYTSYYSGYSLFLTPAYIASNSPSEIYSYIHIINAVMWSLMAILSCSIIKKLGAPAQSQIPFLGGLAVSCYPAFLVYSSLAVSENLFVLVTVLAAWILMKLATEERLRDLWLFLGTASYSVLIHPKGVALFISSVLVAYILMRRKVGAWLYWCVIVPVFIFCIVALHYLEREFMKHALEVGTSALVGHYPTIKSVVVDTLRKFDLEFLYRLILSASGEAYYLMVASLGLFYLGIVWLTNAVRKQKDNTHFAYGLFSLTTIALTLGISSLFMMSGDRTDHQIYGRYNEGVIILALMPSLLSQGGWKKFVLMLIIATLLLLIVLHASGAILPGATVLTNIAAVGGIVQYAKSVNLVYLYCYLLLFSLFIFALLKSAIHRILAALVVFLAQAAAVLFLYLIPGSSFRNQQHTLATYVKGHFPSISCINYDEGATEFWEKFNYRFYFLPLSLNAVAKPYSNLCSPLLVTTRARLSEFAASAIPLKQEAYSPETLWFIPSLADGSAFQFGSVIPVQGTLSPSNGRTEFLEALGGGWYPLEGWGVWSSGDAYLLLRLDKLGIEKPTHLRLHLKAFGASTTDPKRIVVSTGGRELWNSSLTSEDVFGLDLNIQPDMLKKAKNSSSLLILRLQVSNVRSPADLGVSDDARKLGVGLLDIANFR